MVQSLVVGRVKISNLKVETLQMREDVRKLVLEK